MPRIHKSLKLNRGMKTNARDALAITRLAIEQIKLAELEKERAKQAAEEARKKAHHARYVEKMRLKKEKCGAQAQAEREARETLHQKREDWYKGDQKTPYPYSL